MGLEGWYLAAETLVAAVAHAVFAFGSDIGCVEKRSAANYPSSGCREEIVPPANATMYGAAPGPDG